MTGFQLSLRTGLVALVFFAFVTFGLGSDMKRSKRTPVNANASPEAKKLLAFIYRVSGKQVLSAQHNYPGTISHYYDEAHDITGKYPAIWGSDFGFTKDDKDGIKYRQAIIDEAKKRYATGSIITLMWHAVRPTDDEPNGWKASVQNKLTDAEWKELLTPGTKLQERYLAQLDVVAGYLQQLQKANIPVLWRPYHEGNGNWFWWGHRKGSKGYQALYRLMFNYFTEHHHLDNLIWVWNSNQPGGNAGAFKDYYPGSKYVDVLATDVYGNNYLQSHHDDLLKVAAGKPIALGEVGTIPSSTILEKQPRWAWFMIWCDYLDKENTHESIRCLYLHPKVLSREDVEKVY